MLCFASSKKNCSFGRESGPTWDALWWHGRELGNGGWWVMDTECTARARCLCCGADGSPHCSARYPSFLICYPSLQSHRNRRRTFGVFVLPSLGVVGFLRQSLAICWIVLLTAWFVVRLFCFSILAGFQGIRNGFWRAAVRICPHFGLNTWIFSVHLCVHDWKVWKFKSPCLACCMQ